jgi:heat shock protein HslJ
MIRNRLLGAVIAASLIVTLPLTAVAQDEPATPEGTTWDLTRYIVDDELVTVPFGVEATLLLEDGEASGSGGCNSFTGSYELSGDQLTFSDQFARTLMYCEGDPQTVEDAYLSSLPDVVWWAIDDGSLELSDDSGDIVLTFEQPTVGLNPSELAVLIATLDSLGDRISALEGEKAEKQALDRLRERVNRIAGDVKDLKQDVTALKSQPTPRPGPTGFSAAEKVLLGAIPSRIASRCEPLRSGLPGGTVAAVQCSPNTNLVAEMGYYLMDKDDGLDLFLERMDDHGAEGIPDLPPPGTRFCSDGAPSYSFPGGGYIQGVGCYRDGGKANLRIIQDTTDCKQMKVGGTRLKRPVTYIAVEGTGSNIKKLYDWSQRSKRRTQASGLAVPIDRPNAANSPNCPGV